MNWRALRNFGILAVLLGLVIALVTPVLAQRSPISVAGILADRDMGDPVQRAEAVEEIRALQEARKAAAVALAQELGLPTRVERADGTVQEVVEIDEAGELLYFTTHNANAAISTGANLLRTVTGLTGSGLVIGMWDGGSGRSSHQEFAGGRMVVKDGSASIDHATHVGGTMIAAGVQSSARGMAVSAVVDTYDWNSDLSEMSGRAAASPGQAGRIPLSNHSYGYVRGWNWDGQRYVWTGAGTTASAFETNFGVYNTRARDIDSLAFSNPYYLMFWSAGNERSNNPATGNTVSIGGNLVTYDPALHPPGDGVYRGGFENIADNAVAKNVVVVGAVTDAVTSGVRDVTKANPTSFTSYGPTDDGRIKPDLVANGDSLYSSINSSDGSYGNSSGTSMSSPNAAGTAALLIQHYGNLFPGGTMRASTLKGLLIHTADDRGQPGPDYKFGWGLINGEEAARLLSDHAANPSKIRLTEGRISTSNTVVNHQFNWDGISPIRATLSWTDPAGVATTTSDLRTARLVNNLNVKIVGPNGAEYFPYVMPFVGTWTQASMDLPATTGINNTDNVEQVYIAAPPVAGLYQAVVSYTGTLANNQQDYSLLISGSALTFEEEPATLSPTSALSVPGVVVDIGGRPGFRDTPDDYTAWTNGSTGGNGFGAWSLTASGNAGHFLATNEANLTVGSSQGFGLYASGGGVATATRNFNNAMEAGDTFMLEFDNNWVQSGGQVGFSLTDSSGTARLRFYFDGGELFYRVSDSVTGRQTSIPYRDSGLTVYVTLDENGGYTLVAGGSSFSGTLGGGGAISRLVVQNNNAGLGTERNLYIGEMTMTGDALSTNTEVRMVRAGRSDIVAGGVALVSGQLQATFDLTGAAGGLWTVVATNPDGSLLRFDDAFTIQAITPFEWSENFDGTVTGWTSTAVTGSNAWTNSTTQVHSAPNSRFAPGPASITTVHLTSPAIAVPAGTSDLQLRFWHNYNLQAGRDGGRLAISIDNGEWFAVESANSGVAFTQNAYNSTLASTGGGPNTPGDFGGLSAWSGNSSGFIQTVLNVTDSAKFAGKSVRFRWMLGTDASTASTGWYVDSISLTGFVLSNEGGSEPLPATVSLGGLSAVYDGTAKAVSVTTDPSGLAVAVTYNGSANAPVNAGSYAVVATITDPAYTGSASGTLVIDPAAATVVLGNLSAVYDGGAKAASVTTTPSGLVTSVTYNGSASAPVNAGSYTVAATVTDPNYTGSASGTLVIAQAPQTITFGALPTKTFSDASFAAGGTASSGLTVSYASSNTNVATVSGATISIVGAGTATITATQGGNTNYEAAAPVAQTLTVAAASASVTLGNLSQTYDGNAKTASVTTSPADLAVSLTYNDSASAPVNAGSYTVAATVTDPNYTGSASGTLVVARAVQAITFGALPEKTFGDEPFAAGATTSAGLAVSYSSSNTNVATVSGGTISVVGAGSAVITASQAGDTNYEAADPVEQILTVTKAAATVTLGGLTRAYDGEPKAVTVTTDPLGLTVNVTYDGESTPPSEAGSYAVVATVDEANYTGSASGTLFIEEGLLTFERWISRFEGLTDVTPAGDPDGDGLSNAMEYFMDLDPTVPDVAGALVQGADFGGAYLDYRRSKEIHGIIGTVRWSTDPGTDAVWTHESVTDVMLQDHGTWELRRASVPWLGEATQIFLRLDLTLE